MFFSRQNPAKAKLALSYGNCCLYEKTRIPIEAEALLFAADRIEHMQNEITPALAKENWSFATATFTHLWPIKVALD